MSHNPDSSITIQSYADRRATLLITCGKCGKETIVDSMLLARNAAPDTPVENLKFRCRTCFSKDCTVQEYRP